MQNPGKEKINILYLSSFGSLQGGGQRSLLLLMKYLDRSRFTPYLAVPEEGELMAEAQKLGIRVFCIRFPRIRSILVARIVRSLKDLTSLVKGNAIGIIHTEGPRETVYAGIAARPLRVPVVMHLRVLEPRGWLDGIVFHYADRLIAVSAAVAQSSRCKGRKKMHVVYNGVELDTFRPEGTREGRGLRVGYFGRVHRRKGIEVLIRALKRLPDVSAVIVGDGDKRYRKELVCLAGGADIKFKPYQQDVVAEMKSVDVVVLPSILPEGFPRVVIEAMALGKICVASDHPSVREALGEALQKFIVPAGDDARLAEMLRYIFDHKDEMEQVRLMMRKRVEERFDIALVTRQIEAVYQEVLWQNRT